MLYRKTNAARPSLARTLADAVRTWWRHDEIRISPYEGRLLQLDVPCIVEADGQLFEITRRAIGRSAQGKYVAYRGQAATDGADCELKCRPGSPTVQWRDARGTRMINERSIGVFCAK